LICYHYSMKIRMRYFASLREIVGLNEETLDLREDASVADVRALLLSRYPRLQASMERSVCAVNHAYVSAEAALHAGDEVVFIPPVGGGRSVYQEQQAWSQ
jgi:sulfur-carrier protein